MKIEIGDKEYNVSLAITEEEKERGLQGKKELDQDEGMLFIYDEPQTVTFWMQGTEVPLDIIFIDDEFEVISVYKGKPFDETPITENEVLLVLEVNQDSGIQPGDELEMEDEDKPPLMRVLLPDGSTQMELEGGERIFSRKNTRTLIRMAKRAYKSKLDKDYKALGKKMFQYLKQQNERKPEYIETKD